MPSIKVDVEFDYVDTGNLSVPANDELETVYYAPEGWSVIGWGFNASPLYFSPRLATIALDGEGIPAFTGVMVNSDSSSHSFRWSFVLLKN